VTYTSSSNGTTLVNLQSYLGEFGIGHWPTRGRIPWAWTVHPAEVTDEHPKQLWSPMKDKAPLSYVGIRWQTLLTLHLFTVRYWFPVTLSAVFAILPWLPWSFSLRTLLIATSLIAVVLGLVVWSIAP
jgi:hypothetical protein